jgi:hypothetical protein
MAAWTSRVVAARSILYTWVDPVTGTQYVRDIDIYTRRR